MFDFLWKGIELYSSVNYMLLDRDVLLININTKLASVSVVSFIEPRFMFS